MSNMMFPRRVRRQKHSCKLVLVRKIPDRQPVAIYCAPPTLIAGELIQDYLIVGPDFELLDQARSFEQALNALFARQYRLLPKSRLRSQSRPASQAPTTLSELTGLQA